MNALFYLITSATNKITGIQKCLLLIVIYKLWESYMVIVKFSNVDNSDKLYFQASRHLGSSWRSHRDKNNQNSQNLQFAWEIQAETVSWSVLSTRSTQTESENQTKPWLQPFLDSRRGQTEVFIREHIEHIIRRKNLNSTNRFKSNPQTGNHETVVCCCPCSPAETFIHFTPPRNYYIHLKPFKQCLPY